MPDLDERFRSLARTRAPDLWPDIAEREPRSIAPQPRGRRALAAIVALAVATAGIGVAVRAFRGGPERPPQPIAIAPSDGVIAYVVHASGSPPTRSAIFEVAPDGTGRTQLTPDGSLVGSPAWSPDGHRIAYSGRDGIYVMGANGSDVSLLVTDGSDPTWSPDGERIAFACGDAICVMDPDGSDATRLTDPRPADDSAPAWSPDGGWIAFTRSHLDPHQEDVTHLYVMRPDGTGLTDLTSVLGYTEAAWSPDGSKIAFAGRADQHGRSWEIFVMSRDGAGLTRLTRDDATDSDPTWSPDGTQIAFTRWVPGDEDADIYVMNPDGSSMTRVTSDHADETDPSWQPVPVEGAGPTATPMPTGSPAPTITVSGSDVFPIQEPPGSVSAVTYGLGSVWVASNDGSGNGWITRLNTDTGEKLAEISTGDVFPTWEIGGGGLIVGDGDLWMAGARPARGEPSGVHAYLLKIDPVNDEVVATIDLHASAPADVAIDDAGVWVMSFGLGAQPKMEVSRVDPATDEVVATIPLDATYGHHLFAVGGRIVAETNETRAATVGGTVLHVIDPTIEQEIATTPLGTYAWVAAGDVGSGLWEADGNGFASLDPRTGTVISRYPGVASTGDGLAVGEGGVWFMDPEGRNVVRRFNPSLGVADLSVRLPSDVTPIAMTTSPGSLWILDYRGSLVRVDLG